MLKAKSDAQIVLPSFFNMICTQFSKTIKAIRSDNAKELNMESFFASKGILHYHSCVDRPQQNSVVERKHQHILNVARALCFQSHLPLVYWSYIIQTSTYLINRIPSALLKGSTSYELLYLKPPHYDHLRVFGCLAYGSTLNSQRHKFSPRSRASIFIGYPPSMKAYTLLDLQTNQIYHSRDVVFHENIFPFMSQTTPEDINNIFNSSILPTTMSLRIINSPDKSKSSHLDITPSIPNDISHLHNIPTKSGRIPKKPSHLHDYICHISSTHHPISIFFVMIS